MNGSHDPTSPGTIADGFSDFVDDSDQAGIRDEDPPPHAIEQLTLRERTGTTLDQDLEKLEGFWREMHLVTRSKQTPRIEVKLTLPEPQTHRRLRVGL
jgi:hypothetical protein